MSNRSSQTKRPVLQQKAPPAQTSKQIEADKKLKKSKIVNVISTPPARGRVHGID